MSAHFSRGLASYTIQPSVVTGSSYVSLTCCCCPELCAELVQTCNFPRLGQLSTYWLRPSSIYLIWLFSSQKVTKVSWLANMFDQGLACPLLVNNLEINNSEIRWKCQKVNEELKSSERNRSRHSRLRFPNANKSINCLCIMIIKLPAVLIWRNTWKR